MYDTYEMIDKGRIWQLFGILGVVCGFLFVMMGFSIEESLPHFVGVAFIIFGIYSFYYWKNFKQKISYYEYEKFFFIKACKALCDKKKEYLIALKDVEDYYALRELYDRFPGLFNNYASQVLNTPLQLTKPVNPYTAAFIGTQIGGAAVGVVAAQNAIEKQMAYEKNVRDVIESSIRTGNALDKVKYCYESIESIIRKNPDVRDNWANEKEKIDNEIKKQYRVS